MESNSDGILAATWAVGLATIAGPVLAVQAQKIVERIREHKSRKEWIFHTLMATRGQRVALDHVRALNMIDLAFYGSKMFWFHRRKETEQVVIETWHEYLAHLNTGLKEGYSEAELTTWTASGNEMFYNLLYAIASDVGYKVTRDQLKAGGYSPMAHGNAEMEQNIIRQNAVRVLTGQQSLKLDVTSLPVDEGISKAHANLQTKLLDALEGGVLSVEVKKQNP